MPSLRAVCAAFLFTAISSPAVAAEAPNATPVSYVGAPVLKLEDAGRAPRRLLRYVARPGARRTVVITTRASGQVASDTSPVAVKVPTIQVTADIVVKAVVDGDIEYGLVVTGAGAVIDNDVPPSTAAVARAAVARVKGLRADIAVTGRGQVKYVRFQLNERNPHVLQMLEGLRQALIALSPVLPDEPVGSGARWEETLRLKQNEAVIVQHSARELVSVAGNTGRIRSRLQQSAGRQPIRQNGGELELLSSTGAGTSDVTFDLVRLVPSASRSEVVSESKMQADGEPVVVKQTSSTELRAIR